MKQLHNFIATLNLSLKAGHFFFKSKKTKRTLQLVQLLIKCCYFIGYKASSTELLIFFKLTSDYKRPLLVTCQLMKSGTPTYLKWDPKWAQVSSILFILSTSKGLVTQKEAFQQKLGGRLLLKIT